MTGFVVSDRRRKFLSFAAITLLGACLLIAAAAGAPAADVKPNVPDPVGGSYAGPPAPGLYRAGEVVVAFKETPSGNYRAPDSPAMQAHARIGAEVKRDFTPYGLEGIHVVRIPPGLTVEKAIAIYESNPNVRYAEPNYLRELLSVPDDPSFSNQWGLLNTGQSGGLVGTDIDVVPAWDITTGSSSVVVAVLDTGVDYTHSDLAGNIWSNTGEIPGDGIDNDNNLYVDDVRGWDFADDDATPYDDHNHGTHCAGVIGAAGNNGIGVSGVMQHVRLMPVRIFSAKGTSLVDSEHLVAAWLYAAGNGARIISCSFGGGPWTYSELEREAIEGTDALFVIAAGNGGTDNDVRPAYPASYPLPNIISVTATNSYDQLPSFSNYGSTSVDLAAPGSNIYSTFLGSDYGYMSGTSMAAPHVAGVAGLVLSNEPGLSASGLRSRILASVDPVPALQGRVATGGRLNAYRALGGNPGSLAASFTAKPMAGTAPLPVWFTDTSTGAPTAWTWTFGDGSSSTEQNPSHTYTAPGTYTVTLTVSNAAGESGAKTVTDLVRVTETTDFGGALEAPTLVWDTDTGAPWTVDTTVAHDGEDSARSGFIGNYASSRLSATVTGPATVSFWWKVSSEYVNQYTYDALAFTVDHSNVAYISGEQDWAQYQYNLPAGTHSLVWTYVKNGARAAGSDAGWIDRVTVATGPAPTVSSITPNTATQGSTVTVTDLAGTGFQEGATVTVGRAGSTDIAATDIAVVSPTRITCRLDLPGTATPGPWDVTVTNTDGQSATLAGGFTLQQAPPVADFTQDTTSGKAPLTVRFTDGSTNSPTGWSWTFGDGGASDLQNPEYEYSTPGTYTVTLTATNAGGSNTVTKTDLITVQPLQPPAADFSAAPTSGKVPLDVAFTDLSTGATAWVWDFGDGGGSTLQNPSHQYTNAGTFTVRLTATNADGSDLETKEGYITVSPLVPPVASFMPTVSEGKTPLTILFTDTSTGSTPTSWSWTFGDGGTSTEQNPSHEYTTAGTYTVTLTASNDDGSDTVSVANCVRAIAPTPPVADFTQDTTNGKVSLTVHFTDESTNIPTSWSWSFGDGGTSTLQSPTHTYTTVGTFTVTLTATNVDGSNTMTKTDLITVLPLQSPAADFSAMPTSGKVPLDVAFTDLSTGATEWAWEFGDGGTSTQQNPTHRYTTAGSFTVRLTATNADGSDVEAKAGYVTVSPLLPPVAAFSSDVTGGTVPFAVQFTDASTNVPTSWSWDFGDGGSSTLQNPNHQYSTAGIYTVRLTASNTDGRDVEEKVGYITARSPVPPPVASFTPSPSSGLAPLAVQFTDTSAGGPTSWSWSFGDGGTSTLQSPAHTYTTAGVYTVTLTATNPAGPNTTVVEGAVTVVKSANQPVAAFAWAVPAVAGYPVQFTDLSVPAPGGTISSWAWMIGGTSYTVQNPSHTFASPGDHAATLRVKQGKVWSLVLQKTVHVQAGGTPPPTPLTASFSAAPTSGKAPLTVQFTDLSIGGPTAWQWDFNNDGVIDSTLQNPSFRYTTAGAYTVRLTVIDASGGTASTMKTDYITVRARR